MYNFPIGAMLESFQLPFREAVEKAASIGVQGLQMYMTSGEMAPENLTPGKIAEMLDIIKSNGLKVSAICGDFGHGFGDPNANPELIERSKRVMDLTMHFETNIVTTHIGVVPQIKNIHVMALCRMLVNSLQTMQIVSEDILQ